MKLLLSIITICSFNFLFSQVNYNISSYSGNLQTGTISVNSSAGDLVAGELTTTNITIYNAFVIILKDDEPPLSVTGNYFRVYPNPVSEILKVETSYGKIEAIEIHDIKGRKIEFNYLFTNELDLSQLTPGTYMLRLTMQTPKTNKLIKIIKLK